MNLDLYYFLGTGGTVQASAADAVLADHVLTVTGLPPMDYRMIESIKLLAAVAETAYASTVTPTNAASTTFSLRIEQWRPDLGITVVEPVSHTTAASGSSATTICTALGASIQALINAGRLKMSLTLGATIVFASAAGFPKVTVTDTGPGTSAVSGVTAGIVEKNTYSQIYTYRGITTGGGGTAPVAGQTYLSVEFVVKTIGTSDNIAGNTSQGRSRYTVFVNTAATNRAALQTAFVEYANGVNAGQSAGGTVNPEMIALGSPSTT